MPQPVVHLEVIGKDPTQLRKYFGELFGWEFDVPSPVAKEVSEPANYAFLDLVTSEDGTGIREASAAEPATRATPSSTWASRMSRQRCSAPRISAEHGSWATLRHPTALSSGISPTLKAR